MKHENRSEHRPSKISKNFEFLGIRYKVEYHYGSGVMEVFEWCWYRPWWNLFTKKWHWKRLYFGHRNPLRTALDFADEHAWTDRNWDQVPDEHKPINKTDGP